MTEIVKSIRYYRICMQGLPRASFKSHRWALVQTMTYYKHRKAMLKRNDLGFSHQFKSMVYNLWYRR